MLYKLAIYLPLWASCLMICLGSTLMIVVPFSVGITSQSRAALLRVSCYAGLFFLLCTGQWVYALFLIGFIFDRYDHAFQRWLGESGDKPLRSAAGWLILGGCLGLIDALNWLPVFLRPLTHALSHPAITVGTMIAVLVAFSWSAIANAKRISPPSNKNSAE